MKTENVAESHQTDIPYKFPAGHETTTAAAPHADALQYTDTILTVLHSFIAERISARL